MHFAASCGKLRFVRELLNHGADPNIPDCVSIYKIQFFNRTSPKTKKCNLVNRITGARWVWQRRKVIPMFVWR